MRDTPRRHGVAASTPSTGEFAPATTSLADEYSTSDTTLPAPGQRSVVVDSAGRRVAIIEVTSVRVLALGEVDLAHARADAGAGSTLAHWRTVHEDYWRDADADEPGVAASRDDATRVVLERFVVVRRLD